MTTPAATIRPPKRQRIGLFVNLDGVAALLRCDVAEVRRLIRADPKFPKPTREYPGLYWWGSVECYRRAHKRRS
jgi:hypothetical protein